MRKVGQGAGQDASGTRPAFRGNTPHLPGQVTAETFADKALAWMRASGRANSDHPVCKADTDGAFECWVAFWHILGMPTAASEKRGMITVPEQWPWDFSSDADGLRGSAEPRLARRRMASDPPMNAGRARRLADELRNTLRAATPPKPAPRRPNTRLPDTLVHQRYVSEPIDLSLLDNPHDERACA